MKGVIKCFSFIFTFLVVFLVSSSVSLSDVSATSWSIDAFMVHHPAIPNSELTGSLGLGEFSYTLDSLDNITPRNTSFFTSTYNSSSRKCVADRYINPGYTTFYSKISWGSSFVPNYSDPSIITNILNSESYYLCMTMYPFGSEVISGFPSIPEFDKGTIPLNETINWNSMLPYHYMFNNIYMSSSRDVNGVYYSDSFDLSDMLNLRRHYDDQDQNSNYSYYSDRIKDVNMLLSVDSSHEALSSGTSVTFSGSVYFGTVDSIGFTDNLSGSGLSSSEAEAITINLRLNASPLGNDINIPCESLYDSFSQSITYYCTQTLSVSYPKGTYSFNFHMKTSNSVFTSNQESITFSPITYISNSDSSTNGGSISYDGTGSFPNVAPGTPATDPNNADYSYSLTNLFSFNFFNPFAPIFTMFTSGSDCVYIPILSSMLHSNESVVCPWFSSNVRNIVTPVVGLSSMMLLFGFIVRWLGSSSGNMFEDQTSHKWGNTQIKSKGVK